ncbi:hypothetical protein O7623_04515 [Solwaraspora sp. WMMD791]|uniref:hypothetical protein n=1 Tax=Solwaraspora sp. WMMD791 TaxID=3016086 RepID=UPI002499FB7D|nr:hypothetical protein [Solwaraspora sp. WMMD791]WFE28481.1 hypothetical protein O7623_04515 [Solwaraspora sp. WMMD791]
MNSEFGDWPGDDFPGDDADTADLGGGVDDGPLPQEGFGPADAVSGFGAADDVPFGDDSDDGDSGGGAGALSYGGDLSEPDPVGGDDADTAPAEAGFGAAPAAETGFGPADPPPGADPDAPAGVDEWPAAAFPPPLDPSGVPTPVDGWPWADPELIGGGSVGDAAGPSDDPVDPADVAGYAGLADNDDGTRQWATLIASDDPATSTLARFWSGG